MTVRSESTRPPMCSAARMSAAQPIAVCRRRDTSVGGCAVPRPEGRAAQGDAGNRRRKAGPLGQLPRRADETRNGRQSEQHDERGAQEGDARIKTRQDDARRGAKVA
jgi:hypothetical protein